LLPISQGYTGWACPDFSSRQTEVISMLVQVQWTNNRYDYVEDFMLDGLIEMGVVSRFWRSTGWATVGVDHLRGENLGEAYQGAERRSEHLSAQAPR
jgi:hypothetical protein